MSDKEVRIRITGDASDLLKKLEAIKDSFDDLGKNQSSNKAINSLIDGLKIVLINLLIQQRRLMIILLKIWLIILKK